MRATLLALGALTATAAAFPFTLPNLFSTDPVDLALDTRAASNCTQYCSNSAGCVCTVQPSDCTAFYTVQPSDTCLSIAKSYNNFTVTQLYKWNPDIGQTCFGLQAYVPICINTPWYTFKKPVQPAYGTHYKPSQTPVPIMPRIVQGCKSFELVAPGTTVESLSSENAFPDGVSDYAKWNGNSSTAWAAYWSCVKV